MFFKEWVAQLVRVITARIQRRISMAGLSLWLGRGITFVLRALGNPRGPRVGDALLFLEKAGDENPPDAFHESFERVPRDLVRILASCRERQGLEPSPFLVAMAPRLLALSDKATKAEARWRSRLPRIRRLEKLRFADHRLAKRKLEWLIGLGTALLERLVEPPRQAISDLACALASLAVVYRQAGRRDDSLDAFLLAWPLKDACDEPYTEGVWCQKSAYLLVDLDRCDRAIEFLEEALALFALAAAQAEQIEVLVDIGYVLNHAGKSNDAKKWLKRTLPLIPSSDRTSLFAVHQLLAVQLARLGEVEDALVHLELAEGLVGDYKLGLAELEWSRAALAVRSGDVTKAFACYRRSIALYECHGSEALVATVTFECAEILIRENRRPELLELTTGASRWAGEAKRNRAIREAFEDLAALPALEKLNIEALTELRKSLPSQELPYSRRRGKAQPCGGNPGPYSGSASAAEFLFGGRSAPTVAG